MENIEYRVRPVTRYVVTRYEQNSKDKAASCRTLGEYDNRMVAQEVGLALCKAEHDRLGWAPGDPRMIYPQMAPDTVVDDMVNRFLGWKLPADFHPDCGIHFDADAAKKLDARNSRYEPVGTNLFTADQARAMVKHLLDA